MYPIRIYKKEFQNRASFIGRGWQDHAERLVFLAEKIQAGKINLDVSEVRNTLSSSLQPLEKQKKLTDLLATATSPQAEDKPSKAFASSIKHQKIESRSSSLSRTASIHSLPDALIQEIYSYVPYRKKDVLSLVNFQFYSNHLPSYIPDLLTSKEVVISDGVCQDQDILRCDLSDVLRLAISIEDLDIGLNFRKKDFDDQYESDLLDNITTLLNSSVLQRINTLSIDWTISRSGVDSPSQQLAQILERTPQMQTLNLHISTKCNTSGVGDPYFSAEPSAFAIGQNCKILASLTLAGIPIQDTSMLYILQECPLLQTISIDDCDQLTTRSLFAITAHCPKLTTLHVDYCEQYANEEISALAGGIPALTDLSCCSRRGVTEETLASVIRTHSALKFFNIHHNGNLPISNLTLDALAESCPDLEELSLPRRSNTTDSSVIRLLERCKKLNGIFLPLSRLNAASLTALAKQTHKWEFLELCVPADSFSLELFHPLLRQIGRIQKLSILVHPNEEEEEVDENDQPEPDSITVKIETLFFNMHYTVKAADAPWIKRYQQMLWNPQQPLNTLCSCLDAHRELVQHLTPNNRERFWEIVRDQARCLRPPLAHYSEGLLETTDVNALPICLVLDALYLLNAPILTPLEMVRY